MSLTGTESRATGIASAVAFAWVVFLVLYLAGRPLGTDDLWWHLKLGELYARDGPWLAADPLLFTATSPPDPASWSFDVALHGLQRALGFHGLRVVHAGLVAAIVWQAFGLLRRASGSAAFASAAGAVWLALSWYRLIQLRPHLVSILATLLLARLLFEPGGAPSWRRVGLALLVMLAWANAHALYLLGPLLCGAVGVGIALRGAAARWAARRGGSSPAAWSAPRPALLRIGAATGLGLLVTMLNPRGAARHLTFLRSSREQAIWRISDEWAPFDPFAWSERNPASSLLSTALVDALLVAVVVVAAVAIARAVRRPAAETLEAVDPVDLGLAAAAFVAIAAAVRFEWLAVFPLLYVARRARPVLGRATAASSRLRGAAAAVAVVVAVGLPALGSYAERAGRVPRDVGHYLARPIDGSKYYTQGVRFLRDAGVEGNLFNSYFMGGYLAYWLAPSMKTFVGGTLNYPPQVVADHRAIAAFDGAAEGVGPLELLERNGVDAFFGVGLPIGGGPAPGARYTAAHLEGAPGWRLVFRSVRSAIYLRDDERNAANLERVAAFYRREGVPFDPRLGLDVSRVIRERPRWAVDRGLVPAGHERLVAWLERPDARLEALDRLGDAYAAVGAYALQIENDLALLALAPDHVRAHQRLVYAHLRADRIDRAREVAARLMEIAGDDPRSRAFAVGVARYAEAREREPGIGPTEGSPSPASAIVSRLPLFTEAEASLLGGG